MPSEIYRRMYFPHSRNFMQIESTPRVSTCTLCKKSIIKGEKRLLIQNSFLGAVNVKKGKMFRSRRFYHPECFASWIMETTDIGKAERLDGGTIMCCVDCSTRVRGPYEYAYLHKRSAYVYLCEDCARSERWRRCKFCNQFVKRYSASPIIDEPTIPAGHYCCDYCQPEQNVNTVKQQKRNRRVSREDLEDF